MSAASEPLRIAMVPGVTVTKWTRAWQERRRDVPLAVSPIDDSVQTSVLHDNLADVSFVRLPIESAGLSVIRLYSEVAVLVVAKEHPLAESESVTLAQLENEVIRTEAVADAIELVAAGVGVLPLPHSIARLYARKDLVAVPIADAPSTDIAVVWLAESTTPEIEEFVGIVRGRTAASSRGAPSAVPATEAKRPQKAEPTGKPSPGKQTQGKQTQGKQTQARRTQGKQTRGSQLRGSKPRGRR